MQTIREQFEIQLQKAKLAAKYKGIELDIVMVTNPKYATRISVLGNAISRAAYQLWKENGSNVRKLLVVNAQGEIVL
jgi:hypothetical protein